MRCPAVASGLCSVLACGIIKDCTGLVPQVRPVEDDSPLRAAHNAAGTISGHASGDHISGRGPLAAISRQACHGRSTAIDSPWRSGRKASRLPASRRRRLIATRPRHCPVVASNCGYARLQLAPSSPTPGCCKSGPSRSAPRALVGGPLLTALPPACCARQGRLSTAIRAMGALAGETAARLDGSINWLVDACTSATPAARRRDAPSSLAGRFQTGGLRKPNTGPVGQRRTISNGIAKALWRNGS
jgi:hypothetical protein